LPTSALLIQRQADILEAESFYGCKAGSIMPDALALGQRLDGKGQRLLHRRRRAGIGEAAVGPFPAFALIDQPGLRQQVDMAGNRRGGHFEKGNELANAEFTVAKGHEDPQTGFISQCLGDVQERAHIRLFPWFRGTRL